MLLPSHLRRSRHGVYYFRIILSERIAKALGQTELVRSLLLSQKRSKGNLNFPNGHLSLGGQGLTNLPSLSDEVRE